MHQKSWLLPDGIVELTGMSAQQLEHIRRSLLDLYQNWGYSLIFPPLVEFLDSLIAGAGEDLTLQTFKLTDQVSGRMLGVRADITPQVARHDAYHNTGEVNRLCYAGSVLHTKPSHILANRSLIQAGAELYGHKGISSDLEILELLLSSLSIIPRRDLDLSATSSSKDSSSKDWTLTVGQAAITRSLLESIKIPETVRPQILKALQNRSEPDLIQIATHFKMATKQVDQMIELANLCGNHQILNKVAQIVPVHEADCEALQNLHNTCSTMYDNVRWFFDFSCINNYTYETGIIFHATHAQSAEPLARGGRYDDLSLLYGAQRPAVGFSCDLLALARQTLQTTPSHAQKIWAPSFAEFKNTQHQAALRLKVDELRSKSCAVTTSVHQVAWEHLDSSIQEKYDGYLKFDGSCWSIVTRNN